MVSKIISCTQHTHTHQVHWYFECLKWKCFASFVTKPKNQWRKETLFTRGKKYGAEHFSSSDISTMSRRHFKPSFSQLLHTYRYEFEWCIISLIRKTAKVYPVNWYIVYIFWAYAMLNIIFVSSTFITTFFIIIMIIAIIFSFFFYLLIIRSFFSLNFNQILKYNCIAFGVEKTFISVATNVKKIESHALLTDSSK